MRMFRGEALDIISRELDIIAERLTIWKEAFTQGAIKNLKIKPNPTENQENRMLQEMVGEKSIEIESLYQKIDKSEARLYKETFDGRSQSSRSRRVF